jgi:hypothetical protein
MGHFKGRSSSSSEKAVRVGVEEPSQPSRLVGIRRVDPLGPRGIQGAISAVKEIVSSNMLRLAISTESIQ